MINFPVPFEYQQGNSEVWPSYLAQRHCHTSYRIHIGGRVTHIPYHRTVPTLSCSAAGGLWNAKHNKVQTRIFPNYTNTTACIILNILFVCPFKYSCIITDTESLIVVLGDCGILKQNASGSKYISWF